jgi:hypothetical protein
LTYNLYFTNFLASGEEIKKNMNMLIKITNTNRLLLLRLWGIRSRNSTEEEILLSDLAIHV